MPLATKNTGMTKPYPMASNLRRKWGWVIAASRSMIGYDPATDRYAISPEATMALARAGHPRATGDDDVLIRVRATSVNTPTGSL